MIFMKYISTIFLFAIALFVQSAYSQAAGDSIFNTSTIHTIKFYFSQAKWYDSLVTYKPLDKKMKGNVMIDGKTYNNVGVQFKGNSSFNNPGKKKSWKIDFNEYDSTLECNKEKTLNLNNGFKDPTMMREKITLDFCIRNGIAAPRCTYANVYVNDTLWGFYTIVEQVDKTFLKHWYADNNGNLFKGDPSGSLQWYGSTVSSYNTKYELKTNKTQNNWSDLIHLIDELNNTPAADLHDSLEAVLETNSAINVWAVNILFANLDSYQGSGHNYYIFHDSTYNKFNWITWDVNEAFGNFSQGMSITQMENLSIFYIPTPANMRPLHNNMLQVAAYEQALVDAVCEYTLYDFSSAAMDPKIDSLANFIRTSVYADPNKFYSNQNFEDDLAATVIVGGGPPFGGNYPGLKSFVANKRLAVTTELVSYGCNVGIEENTELEVKIFPNPASNYVQISGLNNYSNYQITVYNTLGQQLVNIIPTSNIISLDGILSVGVLLVEVREISTGHKKITKLVKN